MIALITGASSGMGRDISIYLSKLGYDVILVARNKERLEEVSKLCKTKTYIEICDLTKLDDCKKLYNKYKDIDILVNNAGFGVFGKFINTSLEQELDMINTNVIALHYLTKVYLKEMIKKDSGRILNIASIAGFLPGPLMGTYYSTKSYVLKLTQSIYGELKESKSNVKISALCPGPVSTNFNDVAGVKFGIKSLDSKYVAKYAVDKMFKNKLIIIPGFLNRLTYFGTHILPLKLIMKINYKLQKKKEK